MEITVEKILQAAPQTNKLRVKSFVNVFNEWSDKFGINTPKRIVHFLAQCWHESGALKYTKELASGQAYEGRKDLGNTQKGDGIRFKGRGYMQLTGRANYKAYQDSGFCVGDLMNHPEWLEQSPGNLKSAMWFWWKNGLNQLADDCHFVIIRQCACGLSCLSGRSIILLLWIAGMRRYMVSSRERC